MALIVALALFVAVKALQRYQLIRSLRMSRVSVDELNNLRRVRDTPLIVNIRSLGEPEDGGASPAPYGSTAMRSTRA